MKKKEKENENVFDWRYLRHYYLLLLIITKKKER